MLKINCMVRGALTLLAVSVTVGVFAPGWVAAQTEPAVPGKVSGSSGDGMPDGVPGSSEGSAGMPDTESFYLKELKPAAKNGARSPQYVGALLGLGMHYNRANRFRDAERVLLQALTLVDSGAIKNVKRAPHVPAIKETVHPDGTVSAENMNPPSDYEQMMENLLPALIDAEIKSNHYVPAETHIKRCIAFLSRPGAFGGPGLMSAYWQYSELMRKQKRFKEAAMYKKKGDDINATFVGL